MTYPSKIDDWKLFEKSNPTITLNVLYIKERDMHPAYITKINSSCEKQIIFLMIPNEEKEIWPYFSVKKIICINIWNNFKS